jgi:hypothetical protein
MINRNESKIINPSTLPFGFFEQSIIWKYHSKNNIHILIDCHEDWIEKNSSKTYFYLVSCLNVSLYENFNFFYGMDIDNILFIDQNNITLVIKSERIMSNIVAGEIILRSLGEFEVRNSTYQEIEKMIEVKDFD